jgi:hypothetical protein
MRAAAGKGGFAWGCGRITVNAGVGSIRFDRPERPKSWANDRIKPTRTPTVGPHLPVPAKAGDAGLGYLWRIVLKQSWYSKAGIRVDG